MLSQVGNYLALKILSWYKKNNCFSLFRKPAIHSYAITLKHCWVCAFGPDHVVSLSAIKKHLELIIMAKLKMFLSNASILIFQSLQKLLVDGLLCSRYYSLFRSFKSFHAALPYLLKHDFSTSKEKVTECVLHSVVMTDSRLNLVYSLKCFRPFVYILYKD